MSDNEWQYGPPAPPKSHFEIREDGTVVDNTWRIPVADNTNQPGWFPPDPPAPQPVGIDPGTIVGVAWGVKSGNLTPVTAEEIRDVLAHVEVIETEGADLIASPGQVWLVSTEPQSITMEVELTEQQFWNVVDLVCGPTIAAEMRRDVDDVLRWEGEGGSCLS